MFSALITFVCSASPGLDLTWNAPHECASSEALEAKVARLIPRSRPLAAGVVIERVGDRYRLTLTTSSGQRALEGAQCAEVTNGAALVLAMLMEEEAEAPPPKVTREVVPVPVPQRAAEPPLPEWFGFVRLSGLADVGGLPVPTPGVRLTGGVGRGRVVIEGGLATFLAQTVPIPQLVRGAAQLSLEIEGVLRVCARPAPSAPLEPRACLGVGLGQFRGSGVGIDSPRSETSLFATAFSGVGLQWHAVSRLSVLVLAELGISLSRTTFSLEGQAAVFTTPWVLMRAEAGAEWRF